MGRHSSDTEPDATPAQGGIDLLIIGSGIMGAAVAHQVRAAHPTASIVMVDGGPRVGSIPGQHLHDTPEDDIREQFTARAAAGNQALYVGANASGDAGSALGKTEAGMHTLAAFGAHSDQMPGSSISWNVGGMGVHWAAATPWPYGAEVVDFIPKDEWAADLHTAQKLLHVDPSPYKTTAAGEIVIDALNDYFGDSSDEGRRVQPMPLAIQENDRGRLARTGPSAIFPPLADGQDNFRLLSDSLAVALDHDGARVTGATIRNTVSGEESQLVARVTVVCADTFRTPQLLWASSIRPAALGRYLNEHAFLMGRVAVDVEKLGIKEIPLPREGEWSTASTWLPFSGENQPFHGQIMQSPIFEEGIPAPVGHAVILALYVPTEVRADNWIEFSDNELDHTGMPRMTVNFSYTATDDALIATARRVQAEAASRLGPFDPDADSQLLTAGSSLHFTGTVRMGADDDGTSVCNPDGRVWGFDNLFVAGNGVVPTPLACNSTLTGAITAVRAARAISLILQEGPTHLAH